MEIWKFKDFIFYKVAVILKKYIISHFIASIFLIIANMCNCLLNSHIGLCMILEIWPGFVYLYYRYHYSVTHSVCSDWFRILEKDSD